MTKHNLILFLFLVFFLFSGCQDKESVAELESLKSKTKTEQQNKALIEKMIRELNKGNIESYKQICSTDYLCYSPSATQKPKSLEETIEFGKTLFSAFPDANYTIKDIFVDGDRVIVWNIFSGNHEKEYLGIPATGNKVKVSSILIFRIQNGKIIEEREEADMLGAMMQLGMQLMPKK